MLALVAWSCSDVSVTALDVHSVTVDPAEVTVAVGDTLRLRATPRDASGNALTDRPIAWSSDDEAIATVEGGLVRAVGSGTVPIRASSGGVVGQSTVAVTGPSTIVLSQGTLEFQAMSGTGPTDAQTVGISNGGEAPLAGLQAAVEYASDDGVEWLDATLAAATSPTEVSIRADASELAPGTYNATVVVSAPAAGNGPQTVEVTLVVAEPEPYVRVEPEIVSFAIAEGESNPEQVVAVTNGGGGDELTGLEWTISYAEGGPTDWLEAELGGTTTPAELTLRIDPAGLASNAVYAAEVVVASPDTELSGTVEVRFELGEAPPEIDLGAAEIEWDIVENTSSAPTRTVDIENGGGRTLTGLSATVTYGDGPADGWLNVSIDPAVAPTELRATLATTALLPGDYEATISVASEQANNSPQTVAVSLEVAPRASAAHSTISTSHPTRRANGNQAATITVQVKDARGDNMPGGGDDVELETSVGEISSASHQGGGRYTATLTSEELGTATVTGTVNGQTIDDETTVEFEAGPPDKVEVVDGEDQSAEVGAVLPNPLRARVEDESGHPLSGITVTWAPNDGSVSQSTSTTNANGIATTEWRLGTEAGTQTLVASVDEDGAESATFEATALPGDPASIVLVSGSPQNGVVGEELDDQLVVELRDQYGNSVGAGHSVSWDTDDGSVEADSETGTNGRATARWTLGETPGAQTLEASAEGVAGSVTFNATAVAGPPADIEILGGDGETGTVGETLPLQVRVTDRFGNLLSGETVEWNAIDGTADPETSQTDADGIATTTWTLGTTPGTHTLNVRAGSAAETFTATAEPGEPELVVPEEGNGQTGSVGEPLSDVLEALVTDGHDNPLSGVTVTWTPSPGSGTPGATPPTNTNGIAITTWTLGTTAGQQTLVASVPGAESAVFTATARAGDPATIERVGGISVLMGTIGLPLAQSLQVEVRDEFNNPVPNIEVTWTPASGDGTVSQETSETGSDGRASTVWTLGGTPGLQTLSASIPNFPSVPFEANALLPETIVQSMVGHPSDTPAGSPREVPVTDNANNVADGTTG